MNGNWLICNNFRRILVFTQNQQQTPKTKNASQNEQVRLPNQEDTTRTITCVKEFGFKTDRDLKMIQCTSYTFLFADALSNFIGDSMKS